MATPCPSCGNAPAAKDGFPCFAPRLAGGNDAYNPAHFAASARLQAKNFWYTGRNRVLQMVVRRLVPQPQRVIEVGCGAGMVLSMLRATLPAARCWGSDVYTEGLTFTASAVGGTELMQLDATDLPFVDEFELLCACDVVEHIADDRAALAQFAAAVVPGGWVVLTVPQHPWLWSRMDEYAHHQRRYTRAELVDKVRGVGLEVCKVTSFVSLLLPAMWASRLLQRHQAPRHDGIDPDLEIGGVVNSVLAAVMAIERALLWLGLSLPVGGSLLVVARRPG